jgi:hypothetical protein
MVNKKKTEEAEPKSWWFGLYRGPKESVPHTFAMCELPGGEDDSGLMESDLEYLFCAIIENAHDDLTEKEIIVCLKTALNYYVQPTPSGNAIMLSKKKKVKI